MKITKDTVVTITFRATDAQGKLLEDGKEPRAYLHGGYNSTLPGIFAAVPYCIDLIGGPYIETNEAVAKAFRPKSAIRPKA